jgi:hypothetical protein
MGKKIQLPVSDITVVREYLNGASTYALAEKYECSAMKIIHLIHGLGFQLRSRSEAQRVRKTLSMTDIEIRQIYESGISGYQIAQMLGTNSQLICGRVRAAGGVVRSQSEHSPACQILYDHAAEHRDDPDRLTTEFLMDTIAGELDEERWKRIQRGE